MNIERPTTPWRGWTGKEETEELFKIFVTSIKTAEKTEIPVGPLRHPVIFFNTAKTCR
jgi:hypothetical protein